MRREHATGLVAEMAEEGAPVLREVRGEHATLWGEIYRDTDAGARSTVSGTEQRASIANVIDLMAPGKRAQAA